MIKKYVNEELFEINFQNQTERKVIEFEDVNKGKIKNVEKLMRSSLNYQKEKPKKPK